MAVFRPALSFLRKQKSIAAFARNTLTPPPSIPHFAAFCSIGIIILAITGYVLGFNKPQKTTSVYEVLEPEEWVGKQLPIMEHIDIAEKLKKGRWLVLFYHYDCPDCRLAISVYKQMAVDWASNENLPQIAIIEMPPYCRALIGGKGAYAFGRLGQTKEWFVTTPVVVVLENGTVRDGWEGKSPRIDTIHKHIAVSRIVEAF